MTAFRAGGLWKNTPHLRWGADNPCTALYADIVDGRQVAVARYGHVAAPQDSRKDFT